MLKKQRWQRIALSKAFLSLREMPDIVININCYTPTRNESFNPIYPLGSKSFSFVVLKRERVDFIIRLFKIILRSTPLCVFRCNSWTVSSKMTTPSKMFHPHVYTVWVEQITRSITEFSLMATTFVKSLKLVLSRQIGQYCWMNFTSWTFGIRLITPKLKLKSGKSPAYKSWNICFIFPLLVF